jgi:uncharacterized lipoprotein YbaY
MVGMTKTLFLLAAGLALAACTHETVYTPAPTTTTTTTVRRTTVSEPVAPSTTTTSHTTVTPSY